MNIYPRLTPSRRKWLEELERGPAVWEHGRGRTRYDCWALGWTEWVRGLKVEQLTDEGWRVLEECRKNTPT